MKQLKQRAASTMLKAELIFLKKRDAVDQIIVMFIIIALAAGFAGLLYAYGTGTLLPAFENRLTTLINSWFDHA